MKTLWIKSLTLLGLLALHSHAIFGIGGHWAPVVGLEVKESRDTVAGTTRPVILNEKGASGLQGFGAKLWIDAFPFVDIQLSGNMQFGYYDVDLILPGAGGTTPISFKLPIPFLKGQPFFGRIYGDAALLYPFLKFPPMVSIVKLYGGAGLTYGVATEILSAELAKDALTAAATAGTFIPDTSPATVIAPILIDAIKDEGLISGMGGFIQIGAQAKPPVVPIAVYLDFKYHFLGFNPDLVSGGFTMELGAALAF